MRSTTASGCDSSTACEASISTVCEGAARRAMKRVFAVAMTVALGPEAPLAFSVWSASAGAALLATLPEPAYVWSIDHLLHHVGTRQKSPALGRVAS